MLRVFRCDIVISTLELGLTRDKYSKVELRSRITSRVNLAGWQRHPQDFPLQRPLGDLVDDFAAKVATGAVVSLQKWAQIRPLSGFTVGGRRVVSRPLFYTRDQIRPHEGDIGAIGEGVAGYYLESIEGLLFEIRPFDVSPDLIFRDTNTGSVILCEVKTSLESWPRTLTTDTMKLIDTLSKTLLISPQRYIAYVVHVKIVSDTDFELRRLRVEVR